MSFPIKTIEDKESGRKWEIFKKSDNQYYFKYFEFFKSCGWKYLGREGDHINGYLTKDQIEYQFDVFVA